MFFRFLALSLLPLLLVISITAAFTASDLLKSVDAQTSILSSATTDQMETRLNARLRAVQLLAASIRHQQDRESEQQLMREVLANDPYLEGLYIAAANGTVENVALAGIVQVHESDLIGLDLSARPFYQASRNDETPNWSDTLLSPLSGRVVAALTVPSNNRTVVAELSLQELSRAVKDIARVHGHLIVVLDARGRIITHPDATLAMRQENLSHIDLVRSGMAGGQSRGEFELDKIQYLGSVAPVGQTGWSVLVGHTREAVYQPLIRLAWVLLGGSILTVLGSLAAALLLSRQEAALYRRLLTSAQGLVQSQSHENIRFDVEELAELWLSLRQLFEQTQQRGAQTLAARAQLQAVLNAATEVSIIATDPQGIITVFNRGAEKLLGYQEQDMLGGTPGVFHDAGEVDKRCQELTAELGYEVTGFEAFVATARVAGHEIRDWTYIRRDGSKIVVSLAVTAVHGPSGELTGFLGIAIDQTERRRVASLEVARKAAEAANLAKSEFLSRVSHELRTPLNAMLGFAQLLEVDASEQALTTTQRGRLGYIQQAGWHLVQLIDDVLDLSRIESGTLRVNATLVCIDDLIDEAIALVSPALEKKGLHLSRPMLPDNTPVHAHADKTRLTQILVNLLSNAIKYNAPAGSVVVVVTRPSPGMVCIDVSDSGRGMSEAQLAHLFEPFNRLGMENTEVPGTGIGLVITRRLVELMNGQMDVRSTLGQGSCFSITLHAASPDNVATLRGTDRPALAARSNHQHALLPGADPKIDVLYIEDNLTNTLLMAEIFAMRPACTLHTATSIAEGATLAARLLPHLILLDLHLPDGSGLALLLRLKATLGMDTPPIVVVSADATAAQMFRMQAAGCHRYLTKPLSVSDVLALLDDMLAMEPIPAETTTAE